MFAMHIAYDITHSTDHEYVFLHIDYWIHTDAIVCPDPE